MARRLASLLVVAAVVLAVALVATHGGGDGTAADPPTPTSRATSSPVVATAAATPVRHSGLPAVAAARLPAEARSTLRLIAAGGPFPFARDGVEFRNRERLLPPHARGFYHEYTVPTPGSDDRGARRLIVGDDGGRYYTSDHYASFREVVG